MEIIGGLLKTFADILFNISLLVGTVFCLWQGLVESEIDSIRELKYVMFACTLSIIWALYLF